MRVYGRLNYARVESPGDYVKLSDNRVGDASVWVAGSGRSFSFQKVRRVCRCAHEIRLLLYYIHPRVRLSLLYSIALFIYIKIRISRHCLQSLLICV